MPLNCGINRKKIKPKGSGSHPIQGVAIGLAFAAFGADVAAKMPALTRWGNQACPAQCPVKTLTPGAAQKFTIVWNANTNQWDVTFEMTIEFVVLCAVPNPGGGGKKGGGKKGRGGRRK